MSSGCRRGANPDNILPVLHAYTAGHAASFVMLTNVLLREPSFFVPADREGVADFLARSSFRNVDQGTANFVSNDLAQQATQVILSTSTFRRGIRRLLLEAYVWDEESEWFKSPLFLRSIFNAVHDCSVQQPFPWLSAETHAIDHLVKLGMQSVFKTELHIPGGYFLDHATEYVFAYSLASLGVDIVPCMGSRHLHSNGESVGVEFVLKNPNFSFLFVFFRNLKSSRSRDTTKQVQGPCIWRSCRRRRRRRWE